MTTTASTISYANAYSTVLTAGTASTPELPAHESASLRMPAVSLGTAIKATLAFIGRPINRALNSLFTTSLADDRLALARLANSIADSDPGLASDLRAAAARDW